MAAWSPPGKSVRPQLSRNRVSPVNNARSSLPVSMASRVTLPGVWPGVSSTAKEIRSRAITSPSRKKFASFGAVKR